MDLTFFIHRKRLGRIYYAPNAMISTQDPITLRDYLLQTSRWFTGFWQCVEKHTVPWGGQMIDLEAALLATDGLFSGLLMVLVILIGPAVFVKAPLFVLSAILIDAVFLMMPTILLARRRQKKMPILRYLPHLYFLRFLTNIIFLLSFFRAVVIAAHSYRWNRVKRYQSLS